MTVEVPAPSAGLDDLVQRESAAEVYEDAPCGYLSVAPDGTLLRVNSTLLTWLGRPRSQLVGVARFPELLTRGHRVLWLTHHLRALQQTGELHGVRLDLVGARARVQPFLVSGTLVRGQDGAELVRLTLLDATERQAYEKGLVAARDAAERAERRVGALQRVSEACAAADTPGELLAQVVRVVGQALDVAGVAVWLPEGDGLRRVGALEVPTALGPLRLDPGAPGPVSRAWRTGRPAGPDEGSGELVAVPLTLGADRLGVLAVLPLEGGRVELRPEETLLQTVAAQVAQALARSRLRAQMRRMALHDALTDLPNRLLLADRLRLALARAQRTQHALALMVVDLDGFKAVNDTSGHAAGDRLLQDVAQRLVAAVRPGDTVARLGGDEFAVLCEDTTPPAAEQVAERVRAAVATPLPGGARTGVTASIGMAVHLPGGADRDGEDLLALADAAMYEAKSTGKNRWTATTVAAAVRRQVEADLRSALERGRVDLHYQPVLDLSAGEPVGVEALLRLGRADGTLIAPNELLPVAEALGLLVDLGALVLGTACRQALEWDRQGVPPLAVSVNVAAAQACRPDLDSTVLDVLAETGLAPERLVLELTESALLESAPSTLRALHRLRAAGVGLSLDDFGTGFASLQYVRQFPLTELKIDRIFIAGLPGRADDAIVRSVANLAADLGLSCVAEGIETEQQLDAVRSLGLRGQGHLLGRPVPPDVLAASVRR